MLKRMTAFMAAVTPALALAACEGLAGSNATVTDSAGVAIVENAGPGVWGGEVPELERTLDIGSATGDANAQFGQVAAIDVDAAGNVYVLDAQARHVKVFGPDGEYLRTTGGPGSGPGELGAAVVALMVGPGDTLLVPDLMQQRIVRYAPNGEPAGEVPLPMQAGIALRWEKLPDGRLVQQSRAINMQQPTAAEAGAAEAAPPAGDPLIVRGTSGEVVDTLMTLPPGQSFQMSGGQMQMKLFEAEPVWSVLSDGGVAYAMNSDYSIREYAPSGELERIVRRPMQRRPVTEEDKQAMLELMEKAMREQIAQMGVPPAQAQQAEQGIQQMMSLIQFADYYPAFVNLMGGPDGSLWVQQGREPGEIEMSATFNPQEFGAPRWDVFDADGQFLGVIEFPNRFTPLRFAGSDIYGVERDDMDVPHVVRLALPRRWGGSG